MANTEIEIGTYADLLVSPEHVISECLFGELVTYHHGRPRQAHARTALGAILGEAFRPDGWRILYLPEIHLGEHVVVPDVAGWRRERLPKIPETDWFDITPDWVCEILSPATARYDRVEKADIYAAQGVNHFWLVDPDQRTLEVFELREGAWLRLQAWPARPRSPRRRSTPRRSV